MACETPKAMTARLTREMAKQIKEDNPKLAHSQAIILAKDAATKIVEKAFKVAKLDNQGKPEASPAIKANASKEAPGALPEFTVPGNVIMAQRMVKQDNTKARRESLINTETSAGMRNDKGEMIVTPVYPQSLKEAIYGSKGPAKESPMAPWHADEYYYDKDGSMSNAENVNQTLKDLDKENLGDDFNEEWSKELDETLEAITQIIGDIKDGEIKITKATFEAIAKGGFNPAWEYSDNAAIAVRIDSLPKGTEARNRFTMTNQEVYIHELTHAVIDFMMAPANRDVIKGTEMANLFVESKRLYNIARKNSHWKDLLVNVKNPTVAEIALAQERYDYIFNNDKENDAGLHEFMAHLNTNKQFREAMDSIVASSSVDSRSDHKKAADRGNPSSAYAGKGAVERLKALLMKAINKIFGIVTASDGSITEVGSKLLLKIIEANHKAADVAIGEQQTSISTPGMEIFDKAAEKVAKAFEKADATLKKHGDKAYATVVGKMNKTATKKHFTKIYGRKKLRFFRDNNAFTAEARAAIEHEADVWATAAAEQEIADSAKKVAEKIKSLSEDVSLEDLYNAGKAKNKEAIREFSKSEGLLQNVVSATSAAVHIVGNVSMFALKAVKPIYQLYLLHKVARGVYGERAAEALADQIHAHSKSLDWFHDSMVGQILKDFYEKDGVYNAVTDSILKLTHDVDQMREKAYEGVLRDFKEAFGNIDLNKEHNKAYNAAITDVILRTDIQVLELDAKGLLGLLANPAKVEAKIKELEAKFSKEQNLDATLAAEYMTTGVGLITNASNIVRNFGREVSNAEDVDEKLAAEMDKLITYKALAMTSESAKNDMGDFLKGKGYAEHRAFEDSKLGNKFKSKKEKSKEKGLEGEYKEQVEIGVDTFIAYARGMAKASKREMALEPHNEIKGYMKETFDNHTELDFFPMENKKALEAEGYTFIRETKPVVKGQQTFGMFVIKDARARRVNGALGLQGKHSRGKTLKEIINDSKFKDSDGNVYIPDAFQKADKFQEELKAAKKKYAANPGSMDMYPVFGQTGNIIDFRITMTHDEKMQRLNMETRGTENLARTTGTTSTARKTAAHNKEVLKTVYNDFRDNYKGNESEYVEIKPEDMDAEEMFGISAIDEKAKSPEHFSRLWARLPKQTRKDAWNLYKQGGNGTLIVRKDLVEALFGYEEMSLSKAGIFKNSTPKAKRYIRRGERVWQELMQIAKSNIVIKTPIVLVDNLWSNAKILMYIGVNPVKGMKLLSLAVKDLKRYENDVSELARLKRRKEAGMKFSAARMKELESDIAGNSVKPLIDAGLFQSIVEDVDTTAAESDTSKFFSDTLDRWVPNEVANSAINHLFMTSKTKPFQMLTKMTQVSDFYFRYAQYYDMISKGATPAEALRDVTDYYINYEAPLNKFTKYGDRMAAWPFITYFVKIQNVVKRMAKANPSRILADIAAQQFIVGDNPDVLDMHFLDTDVIGKFNPLRMYSMFKEAISPTGYEWASELT